MEVFFLRGAAIIFAFQSPYTLFPNTSKEDCTVVTKISSGHQCLVYARICDLYHTRKRVSLTEWSLKDRVLIKQIAALPSRGAVSKAFSTQTRSQIVQNKSRPHFIVPCQVEERFQRLFRHRPQQYRSQIVLIKSRHFFLCDPFGVIFIEKSIKKTCF